MTEIPEPLFHDPIHDGAADPTVIWNRAAGEWWMFYTTAVSWRPRSTTERPTRAGFAYTLTERVVQTDEFQP